MNKRNSPGKNSSRFGSRKKTPLNSGSFVEPYTLVIRSWRSTRIPFGNSYTSPKKQTVTNIFGQSSKIPRFGVGHGDISVYPPNYVVMNLSLGGAEGAPKIEKDSIFPKAVFHGLEYINAQFFWVGGLTQTWVRSSAIGARWHANMRKIMHKDEILNSQKIFEINDHLDGLVFPELQRSKKELGDPTTEEVEDFLQNLALFYRVSIDRDEKHYAAILFRKWKTLLMSCNTLVDFDLVTPNPGQYSNRKH